MNKHIPSLFTSLNLLCGCLAIAFASKYYYSLALNFIVIAAVFDFIDGISARLLNAKSEFGKQLDSLSDVVSFGVAPAFMIYQFMTENYIQGLLPLSDINSILPYFAFLIPIFSALRLAKFNIDTRQSEHFIGLPTPANGLFFASLPFVDYRGFALIDLGKQFKYLFSNNYFLLMLIVIFSYLLISNLKLFSLKVKNLSWHENQTKYLFLIISFIFIILFSVQSLPLIILLYLGMSVIDNLIVNKK